METKTTEQKLYNAVLEHSGLDKEDLKEVAQHGADAGWSGFTYYADTIAFYNKHYLLIADVLFEYADQVGMSAQDVVKGFPCLPEQPTLDEYKNAMAWFALEFVAHFIADGEDCE